jgi:hypothetical protein
VHERGGVVEAAPPDADASVGEVLGLAGVADADADAVGGNALQEAFDDAAAELSSGSGHDDHRGSPDVVSSGIAITITLEFTVEATFR